MSATNANPEKLLSIIEDAHNGKVVLPEFQRSFLWARSDIEELLVSLLQGFFVGTFLIIDTPSNKPIFPYRTVEGVDGSANPQDHATIRLILDGQQRISSLYYALYAPDEPLSSTVYPYRFFWRIDTTMNDDLDASVVGISTKDRRRMSEMQRLVNENKALPFTLFKSSDEFNRWLYRKQQIWSDEELSAIYKRFAEFMVPVVSLSSDLPSSNVVNVVVNIFERINRTGVSLSLFDLAVARLYVKGVKLRDLLEDFEKRNPEIAAIIKPDYLLRVIALLEDKEPKRGNLLNVIDTLDKAGFESRWHEATKAIIKAHERIRNHYGAFSEKWIPYSTMHVPLAAMLHQIHKRKGGEADYRKVDHWYWTTVFTQRYDSSVDSQSLADIRDLNNWISNGAFPSG